jgi:hypothetical protein
MVQVVTEATRAEARKRIGGIEQREVGLSKIEATAKSPMVLRRGFVGRKGVLQKKELAGKIGGQREILGTRKAELTKITKLPTREEYIKRIENIQRVARKLGRKGRSLKDATSGLSSEEKKYAKQAWLGGRATERHFQQREIIGNEIISSAEEQAGMTFIPSERQRIKFEGLKKLGGLGKEGGDFKIMTAGGEVSFTTLDDVSTLPMSIGRTPQEKFMDLITTKDKMSIREADVPTIPVTQVTDWKNQTLGEQFITAPVATEVGEDIRDRGKSATKVILGLGDKSDVLKTI